MVKSTFYLITISNRNNSNEFYSYPLRVPNYQNLWHIISGINAAAQIITLNACDSKAEAVQAAEAWNRRFKETNRFWEDAIISCYLVHAV